MFATLLSLSMLVASAQADEGLSLDNDCDGVTAAGTGWDDLDLDTDSDGVSAAAQSGDGLDLDGDGDLDTTFSPDLDGDGDLDGATDDGLDLDCDGDGFREASVTLFDPSAARVLGLDEDGATFSLPSTSFAGDAEITLKLAAMTEDPRTGELSVDGHLESAAHSASPLPETGTGLVPHYDPIEPTWNPVAELELVGQTQSEGHLVTVGGGDYLTYALVALDGAELGYLDVACRPTAAE